jgi:hypothetical protein
MTDTPALAVDEGEFLRLQLENSRLRLVLAMAENVPQPDQADPDAPAD